MAGTGTAPSPGWPPAGGGTWVLDLDGVVWLTGIPIRGAARAVHRLHAAGIRTVFATNNSAPTKDELVERLGRCDITASPGDVVSSAEAAAMMIEPGARALLLAGGGVREALRARGVEIVGHGPADVVVVGWTRAFDFDSLADAAAAVRAGARLVGTNEDPTYPTPDGLVPGCGALLAAVAVASGVTPEVGGKPHRPLVHLLKERFGDVRTVVGDRASTDGRLARRLGVPFALVLSGVTSAADPVDEADVVADDLQALVDLYLSLRSPGH